MVSGADTLHYLILQAKMDGSEVPTYTLLWTGHKTTHRSRGRNTQKLERIDVTVLRAQILPKTNTQLLLYKQTHEYAQAHSLSLSVSKTQAHADAHKQREDQNALWNALFHQNT